MKNFLLLFPRRFVVSVGLTVGYGFSEGNALFAVVVFSGFLVGNSIY